MRDLSIKQSIKRHYCFVCIGESIQFTWYPKAEKKDCKKFEIRKRFWNILILQIQRRSGNYRNRSKDRSCLRAHYLIRELMLAEGE